MKILSVDTSSNICSVAILENENLIDEINLDNGKTHSENFMPIMDELLKRNNLSLDNIELISCVVGPGSFTGIRIGVSTIKAIAEVKNIKIASVTSLETLASIDNSEKIKIALINANNNQVYCGIFDKNYKLIEEPLADSIENVVEILKKYQDTICIGSGAIMHKEMLEQDLANVTFAKFNDQTAFYAGKIGYKKFQENNLKTADEIIPIYLRKSQAERLKK